MLGLKVIVNCGPCERYIYKCLTSLRAQSYENWHALVSLDPWGDQTYARAIEARAGDARISIVRNSTREYAMHNLVHGIARSAARPDDVIVILDGDDWFFTVRALSIIVETYSRFDCWMTYGSWISDAPDSKGRWHGRWPAYPPGTTAFRQTRWLGTAVRTWKKWLWDCVDDRDLRDDDGKYFRVTEDQAAMLPMLEMSGTNRARHIPEALMVYNRSNPHACGKRMMAEMTRNGNCLIRRPPYTRLRARPVTAPVPVETAVR